MIDVFLASTQHRVQYGQVAWPEPLPLLSPCPLSSLHEEVSSCPTPPPPPSRPDSQPLLCLQTALFGPAPPSQPVSALVSPKACLGKMGTTPRTRWTGGACGGARGFPQAQSPWPCRRPVTIKPPSTRGIPSPSTASRSYLLSARHRLEPGNQVPAAPWMTGQ